MHLGSQAPHCTNDLNGSIGGFQFAVDSGAVSGSSRVSNLEKTVTMSGTINGSGSTSGLKADLSNN